MSRPVLSRLMGMFTQRRMPKPLVQAAIRWYIDFFDVDTSEMDAPLESFNTFDDFFTRTLKPGVHKIDTNPNVAISPVDGCVLNFGEVSDGRIDQIKGRNYSIEQLLDSTEMAEKFSKGHYVTVYLSPRDYHRIHTPVAGKVSRFRYVPGRLYPVNSMGVNHVHNLFAVNERLISYMESDLGDFAVCKVGATNVGMITASYHSITTNRGQKTSFDEVLRRKVPLEKGAELGQFHLGSTVVLLAADPTVVPADLKEGQYMRLGEPLMHRKTKQNRSKKTAATRKKRRS